jgi:hypothetical protein
MLGWLLVPPASVVAPPDQAKVLNDSASVSLFPAAPALFAVTVTTAPLDVAVTTVLTGPVRFTAEARFAASVVVSVDVAKLVPVFVPSVPPLSTTAPPVQENPVKPLDRLRLLPADPAVDAVTVTVVLAAVAVASVLAELAAITAAMLVASWVVLAGAAPDQYWKLAPVLDPFVPAVDDNVMFALEPLRVSVKPVEPAVTACKVIGLAPDDDVRLARPFGVAPLAHRQLEALWLPALPMA